MKPKTMMLMVVAVGCGLAASYMTSRLLADRSTAPTEEAKVQVLAAKTKVPAWVLIKEPEKYFEVKELPESAAPKKALKDFSEVKDQRLSQALSEGEYVLSEKLVNSEQVGLIAKLPSGMRAIALKVNAESLAGGFVLPGYRVDVVSTMRNGNESVSKIILQNMLVLAVDTNATARPQLVVHARQHGDAGGHAGGSDAAVAGRRHGRAAPDPAHARRQQDRPPAGCEI